MHAGPVKWAEHAKRRARREHESAEQELEAISNVFAVQVDVLIPEGRKEDFRRRVAAQKAADEEAKRAAEQAQIESEKRATEEDAEKARVAAAKEALRISSIPLVGETPVSAILDFSAECEIELGFREGEALHVLDVAAPDGWLMAKNGGGTQGLVPESYMRLKDGLETPKGGTPAPASSTASSTPQSHSTPAPLPPTLESVMRPPPAVNRSASMPAAIRPAPAL